MRRVKKLPPVGYLRECLRYESESGKLYWLERPLRHFSNRRVFGWWNSTYAGTKAFTAQTKGKQIFGSVDNEHYLAHRVIWKLVTGKEPPAIIDHRDRNSLNNRWENLRAATKSQNNINSTVKREVWFDKARNKWQAHIKKNGKRIHLGRYDSEREALLVRKIAAQKYFGEFAP